MYRCLSGGNGAFWKLKRCRQSRSLNDGPSTNVRCLSLGRVWSSLCALHGCCCDSRFATEDAVSNNSISSSAPLVVNLRNAGRQTKGLGHRRLSLRTIVCYDKFYFGRKTNSWPLIAISI